MTDDELIRLVVESNARSIQAMQAMIEQRTTDRPNQEARAIEHELLIARLEDLAVRLHVVIPIKRDRKSVV